MKTYRIWMLDDYASLHNAESEEDAKRQARELAAKNVAECAMTTLEKRRACTVREVNCLSD